MSKRKTEQQTESQDEISFEKALERLETIVEEMESGKLSLEDMMKRFEEGQGLSKLCSAKLNQVERRIEILVKNNDAVQAEPFEDEPDAPAGAGRKSTGDLPF
ncbi:MAG: exodeoxyribonuclease VII small subunit [bacterium]